MELQFNWVSHLYHTCHRFPFQIPMYYKATNLIKENAIINFPCRLARLSSCPTGSGVAWCSRGCRGRRRTCCSSTSRPTTSTWRPSTPSPTPSTASRAGSSSSHTTSGSSTRCVSNNTLVKRSSRIHSSQLILSL